MWTKLYSCVNTFLLDYVVVLAQGLISMVGACLFVSYAAIFSLSYYNFFTAHLSFDLLS